MRLWRLYYQLIPFVSVADYDYTVREQDVVKTNIGDTSVSPPILTVTLDSSSSATKTIVLTPPNIETPTTVSTNTFRSEFEQNSLYSVAMDTIQQLCAIKSTSTSSGGTLPAFEQRLQAQCKLLMEGTEGSSGSSSYFEEELQQFQTDNEMTSTIASAGSEEHENKETREQSFLQASVLWEKVSSLELSFTLHQELHVQGSAQGNAVAWSDLWNVLSDGFTGISTIEGATRAPLFDPDDNGFQSTAYLWHCTVRWTREGVGGFREFVFDATVERTLQRHTLTAKGVLFLWNGVLIALVALCDGWLRIRALKRIWAFDAAQRLLQEDTIPPPSTSEQEENHNTVEVTASEEESGNSGKENSERSHQRQWQQFLQKEGKGESWHYWGLMTSASAVIYAFVLTLEYGAQISLSETALITKRLSLGFAALGTTSLFLSFLRFSPTVYVLFRATRGVLPQLLMIFLAAMPLFIGFALTLFGLFGADSDGEFTSISSSFVHLTFMMYGDSLLPAMQRLGEAPASPMLQFTATAVSCLYVFLFMSVVHNVAIAVVVNFYGKTVKESGLDDRDDEEGEE